MANLKEIKKRIKSVKNTAKVTGAMQMISAIKSKHSEVAVKKSADFTLELSNLISSLYLPFEKESPLMRSVDTPKNIMFLVIGPSRGFVGSLAVNLGNQLSQFIKSLKSEYPGVNFAGISLHKLGFKILNSVGIQPQYHFSDFIEKPTMTNLSPISKVILDGFKNGDFDRVYLVFPKFINLLNFQIMIKKLLPIDLSQLPTDLSAEQPKKTIDENFVFEPSKQLILESLFQKYFESQLISAVLNSNASENSARMMAMKNATDNALDISSMLTLEYNKRRQAKITQQIIEVSVGGRKQ